MTSGHDARADVRRIGVVITSTEHGGAEAHIARIWTHRQIRPRTEPLLLGSLPRWHETGLPSIDLELGAKWSYRRMLRSIASMPVAALRARRTIDRLHRAQPFDAFYAHFKREQVLLSSFLARRAPVIWMEHGHLPSGRLRRPLIWAYRRAARHVTTIICNSASVRNEIARVVPSTADRIVVIENAIDPNWTTPASADERLAARERIGVPADASPVLVTVARLIPRKRIELAIDAVALIPEAWLVVCGSGPLEHELRARAVDNPRVVFTGFTPDPRDVYRGADINLLLSWEEGFGQVLLEGAAAGLPAVVVADGGFADRVEGWGAVAPNPTPAAVAGAVERALEVPKPAPRTWAETHGPEAWATAHLRALEGAITSPRG